MGMFASWLLVTEQNINKVKKAATDLGVLEKNFFMMSSVPKNEIPNILSAANVATSLFIDLPEMWNNSANKFFDALASGTPVAINYQGWQAEILERSGAGLVLSVSDPKEAACKLQKSLRDPKWLKGAGEAAKRLAVNEFNRDTLARKLEGVLKEALDDNQ